MAGALLALFTRDAVPQEGSSTPVSPVRTSVCRVPFDRITNRSLQHKSGCRRSLASTMRSACGAYADWKLLFGNGVLVSCLIPVPAGCMT